MNLDNLRNWLASVASDPRARRLLPLLGLLIAAAVAIPLLLSHSGKAASLSPLPPAPTVTAPTPLASTGAGRRHEPTQNYLTGPAHNPFVTSTTAAAAVGPSTTATSTSASSSGPTSGTTSSSSGSHTVGDTCPNGQRPVEVDGRALCLICRHSVAALVGGHLTCLGLGAACQVSDEATYNDYGFSCVGGHLKLGSEPTTTTTTVATKPLPYTNYQVEASILQAGVGGPPTVFHDLSRDQLLPSASAVFATFLGVRRDEQTAVFILPGDTTVTGEGNCAPSAAGCRFLTLIPGQVVKVTLAPTGVAPLTFTLRYLAVHKVSSSASVVAIDPTGAEDVKSAEAYVPQLKTVSYAHYTGLLSITLGSTVPVTP